MPKIWIGSSERYPDYDFGLEQPQRGMGVEVSEEKLQEFLRIKEAYAAMQAELAELFDAADEETHPDHILDDDKKRVLDSIADIARRNIPIAKNGTDAKKWQDLAFIAELAASRDLITPYDFERIKEEFARAKRQIEEESIP